MATQKYTYPFYEPPGGSARPYLPITIVNPFTKDTLLWDCLIDSGADSCLFPRSIASMVGHNLTGKGVRSSITMGVEGSVVRTWQHTFSLNLMHPDRPETIVWRGRKGLFDCIEHDECPPLLGVGDFLKNFRITLDYLNETTTIQWKK